MIYSSEVSARLKTIIALLTEIDDLRQNVVHHKLDELKPLRHGLEKIERPLSDGHLGKASDETRKLIELVTGPLPPARASSRSQAAQLLGRHKSEKKQASSRLNGRYHGGRPRRDGQPQKRKHHPPAAARP